jgi:hypothetical protein
VIRAGWCCDTLSDGWFEVHSEIQRSFPSPELCPSPAGDICYGTKDNSKFVDVWPTRAHHVSIIASFQDVD